MSDYFNALDYCVIAIYAIGVTAICLQVTGRASKSLEGYIVADRQLPWWALGFSGMASFIDMAGTSIIIAFLFLIGPRGLFIEFRGGACLILTFMMLWMGKWHRRSGCLTAAEWMVFRFGDGFGGQFARVTAVLATALSTIGMLAMMVFAAGQFLSVFLPLSPYTCAGILIATSTAFAALSGFYGVVYTDVFQGVFILIATVYVSITAFNLVEDSASFATIAENVTGNANWASAVPHWNATLPPEFAPYEFLMLFAALYLLRQVIGGMAAGDDPKYFGARNDRECGTLTFLWTLLMTVRWPLMIGLSVLGIDLIQNLFPDSSSRQAACEEIRLAYPDVGPGEWDNLVTNIANSPLSHPDELIGRLRQLLGSDHFQQRVKLLGYHGSVNAEKILPAVLLTKIPPGMRGLIIMALISAFMSTFDAHLNRAVGILVNDFYRAYFRPEAKQKELIGVSRLTTWLLVGASVLFAFTIESINDIWSWIIMGLSAGLLGPSVLKFYWWRYTGIGFACGTLTGMLAAIAQRLLAPDMHEFAVFSIVFVAGTAAAILGSLWSSPIEDARLWEFYNRTRPFGFWTPMFGRLSTFDQAQARREHRLDVLAVPFSICWQVSMFMTPMLVLIHAWQAAALWGLAFCISGVGLYFMWYRNLPAENWFEVTACQDPQQLECDNAQGTMPAKEWPASYSAAYTTQGGRASST